MTTWKLKSVGDATPAERELDHELQAVHDLTVDAIVQTVHAEAAVRRAGNPDEALHWLSEIRMTLEKVPVKVENAADCAGNAIHGTDRSPIQSTA